MASVSPLSATRAHVRDGRGDTAATHSWCLAVIIFLCLSCVGATQLVDNGRALTQRHREGLISGLYGTMPIISASKPERLCPEQ